ncbi:hypothetical protein JYU34_004435 [Plutella xylostella]|uniref:FLYWCH-type domain-containing protein n=1 Tax=Plutella xylostella TaxID=51655 RepID=A0ABQ7QY13_PLUXY|nr:hypothetical protein JYU34_004435 [Plutella xylostella]
MVLAYCAEAIFTTSSRGTTIIRLGNYQFYLAHRSKQMPESYKRHWVCTRVRSRACRATIMTVGDQIVKYRNEHTHV